MAQRQAAAAAKVPLGMAGTLFFGSLCVGTGALGIWQTQRFFEKQRLIQQRSTELKLEPLPYPHTFQQPHQQQEPQPNNHHHINHKINNEHSFRRWRLTGHYRHEDEFLVGPRGPPSGAQQEGSALPPPPQGLSSSPQGYYVVTPFQLAVTTTAVDETKNPCHTAATSSSPTATAPSMWVLVNRGWIPRHMVQSQQPQPQHRQQQQQQQRGSTEASPATPPALLEWNRPKGTVQVTVVPAKPEGKAVTARLCVITKS